MEIHSLRFGPRPTYSLERQQAAWRAFLRSEHGMVILDLLLHQAFLVQREALRGLGQQDLMLWIIDKIQDAEAHYGGGEQFPDAEHPPSPEWWVPHPGR